MVSRKVSKCEENFSKGHPVSIKNEKQLFLIAVCSICGQKHYTRDCLELSRFSEHVSSINPESGQMWWLQFYKFLLTFKVPDKPFQNLSRYSVPNGLLIIDSDDGNSFVITTQKFAKGTRFGMYIYCCAIFRSKGFLINFRTSISSKNLLTGGLSVSTDNLSGRVWRLWVHGGSLRWHQAAIFSAQLLFGHGRWNQEQLDDPCGYCQILQWAEFNVLSGNYLILFSSPVSYNSPI